MKSVWKEKPHERRLHLLLAAAFLVHSLLYFIGDVVLYPVTETGTAAVAARIFWQNTADSVFDFAEALFHLAYAATTYHNFKMHRKQPHRNFLLYYLIQIILMFLCAFPFACFDRTFFYNYLSPIYTSAIELGVLVAVTFAVNAWLGKSCAKRES